MSEREFEYTVDRLRAEIRRLEDKIADMEFVYHAERSHVLVAEILLCVISGIAGYVLGVWLA